MRLFMIATASSMLVLSPMAFAQLPSPPPSPPDVSQEPTVPPDSGQVVGAPSNTQLDPNNCGTPDEPKPCAATHHRSHHHHQPQPQ